MGFIALVVACGSAPEPPEGEFTFTLAGLSAPVTIFTHPVGYVEIRYSGEAQDLWAALGYVQMRDLMPRMHALRAEAEQNGSMAKTDDEAAARLARWTSPVSADQYPMFLSGMQVAIREHPADPWTKAIRNAEPRPWSLRDLQLLEPGSGVVYPPQDRRATPQNPPKVQDWRFETLRPLIPWKLRQVLDGAYWGAAQPDWVVIRVVSDQGDPWVGIFCAGWMNPILWFEAERYFFFRAPPTRDAVLDERVRMCNFEFSYGKPIHPPESQVVTLFFSGEPMASAIDPVETGIWLPLPEDITDLVQATSELRDVLVPLLSNPFVEESHPDAFAAVSILRDWNGSFGDYDQAPVILGELIYALLRETPDETRMPHAETIRGLTQLFRDSTDAQFDDPATAVREDRNTLLMKSLAAALNRIRRESKLTSGFPTLKQWRSGEYHAPGLDTPVPFPADRLPIGTNPVLRVFPGVQSREIIRFQLNTETGKTELQMLFNQPLYSGKWAEDGFNARFLRNQWTEIGPVENPRSVVTLMPEGQS